MRVILLALALCAIAFALNLVGDLSTAPSSAAPAPAARATIAPAVAAEPPRDQSADAGSLNKP
jgi:hypothetical protein